MADAHHELVVVLLDWRRRGMVSSCLDRKLAFLVMIYPEAGGTLDDIATDLGLVYAVDFPIMVRDDLPLEPSGNPDVEVVRASGAEDADASADAMAPAASRCAARNEMARGPRMPGLLNRRPSELCEERRVGTRSTRGGLDFDAYLTRRSGMA